MGIRVHAYGSTTEGLSFSRGGVGAEKNIDPLYVPYDMAKELGQIHTVNYTQAITNTGAPQNAILVDLPGQLTNQLQTFVRWGTYHKVVGIDITVDHPQQVGQTSGGQITGYIRYYAPTHGRCEAVRGAFDAMKTVMKSQGISMSDNRQYDFKAPINELSHASGVFPNQATLDGASGLAMFNASNPTASIFNVHNESVRPDGGTTAAADLYSAGFSTLQNPAGGTDFVLNDEVAYSGNRDGASTEYEEIPFQLTFDPTTGNVSTFQWRPDPALFLAVLCGQMSLVVDAVYFDGTPATPTQIDLNLSVMVSGWKSVMSRPKLRARKSSARKNGKK